MMVSEKNKAVYDVNEVRKMLPRLSKAVDVVNGKGVVISHNSDRVDSIMRIDGQVVDLDHIDLIKNYGFQVTAVDNKESYDFCIVSFFVKDAISTDILSVNSFLDYVFTLVKPGGFIVFYMPHKHYYNPGDLAYIPHDVLLKLKHVDKHNLEIIDFQTYCYEGSFWSQDHNSVEYGFEVYMRKLGNLFGRKDLSDDQGQLVSLDD